MNNELLMFKKKLLYRASYRGTKEMDILLTSFVKKNIDNFDTSELQELEKFLNFDDEIIYDFYNCDLARKNIEKNKIFKIFKKFKI